MDASAHIDTPLPLHRIAGWGYFPIAFLARLPFAMNVVGVLTLVTAARESIAIGGLTSAAVGLGTALIGPLLGAVADRWGQRLAVLAAGLGNAIALTAMAIAAYADVPDATLLLIAVCIGATAPQVSGLSRTRLVAMIGRDVPEQRRATVLQRTLAYESAADEIVFVFGPVVVGVLATAFSPTAPVIGAAVLTAVFVSAFALHPSATAVRPHRGGEAVHVAPVSELLQLRVLIVVAGMVGVGLFFGATLTSLTAFMGEQGAEDQTGLLYGVLGVGSGLMALCVALFPARFTHTARWLTFAGIMLAGTILIGNAHDLPTMTIALAITGFGIGPFIVTAYTFATKRTPAGRSATLMTIIGSAVVVGQSTTSALVGALAESAGSAVALWMPAICAGFILCCGVVNAMLTRREV